MVAKYTRTNTKKTKKRSLIKEKQGVTYTDNYYLFK